MSRMDRINKIIMIEVSLILQNDIDIDLLNHLTITGVDTAKDLSIAKIFYTTPEKDEIIKEKIDRLLKINVKHIRWDIAQKIKLKYMPKLIFTEDKFETYRQGIDELFEKIEKENPELKQSLEDNGQGEPNEF
ncbi:Ribosome-binding factor A [Candidatus Omnitrophus magneticus]|uniref:Ribosome-binding factor A n=1 Tax=Candidatus Omnitrophus magneticus TaxID=1609969 RepID=A0A0F0CRB2_9BACT|nr:Ribosome-binding factor A [Candidatus Omnitrophus magneticus]